MATATNGCKIDFTNNTLVMNYKFHSASQEYGTPENNLVKEILKDFPSLTVVVKAGRDVKTTNKNKRLTYENMEKHISCYPNAEELLAMFETAKIMSKPLASPYAYVVDWFRAQFPDYKNGKACVTASTAEIAPLPDVEDYKQKENEEEEAAQKN